MPRLSFVDQVADELPNARIVLLSKPEQRLLPHLDIAVALGDGHEFVDRRGLPALRENEDHLSLYFLVALRLLVERGELIEVDCAPLRCPEDRVLPRLHVEGLVAADVEQPGS